MEDRRLVSSFALAVIALALGSIAWAEGLSGAPHTTAQPVSDYDEGASVAFRAPASTLPKDAPLVQGKAPEDVVEIVLPGRVYDPPIALAPVGSRGEATRKTPEQASASDFAAMRAGDPAWLRENYTDEDYPSIRSLVEDPLLRRMNQNRFKGHGVKTVVSRCTYKSFVLLFARYDGDVARGMVEVYTKNRGVWKRTNALTGDETVALLQTIFRKGKLEQTGE